MINSPENFEKPIYPDDNEFIELERIAQTKATGANTHDISNIMTVIMGMRDFAKKDGWNKDYLETFNQQKRRLYETLAGVKKNK